MRIIIAICGPDGAGKTTITSLLGDRGWSKKYGGKKDNHYFRLTKHLLRFYNYMRRVFPKYAWLFLYFVFYPIEYIENIIRVWHSYATYCETERIVFDRFVVDRMWRSRCPQIVAESSHLILFLDRLYSKLYEKFFPVIDGYVFLCPPAEEIYDRAQGQYRDLGECISRRCAYLSLGQEFSAKGWNVLILDRSCEPGEIIQEIENFLL